MKVFVAISLLFVGAVLAQEAAVPSAGFNECFEKDSISCIQSTVRITVIIAIAATPHSYY